MNENSQKPWFKQVWPWFIISFPLMTVIAGLITYKIAANNPVSMVKDDYFKSGLAINQVLEKQNKAKKLNMSATIEADKPSQLLFIKLTTTKEQAPLSQPKLQLIFSHPTQEKLDVQLTLEKLNEGEFAAQLPALPQANWHIKLVDIRNNWLIKGRWNYPQANEPELISNKLTIIAN